MPGTELGPTRETPRGAVRWKARRSSYDYEIGMLQTLRQAHRYIPTSQHIACILEGRCPVRWMFKGWKWRERHCVPEFETCHRKSEGWLSGFYFEPGRCWRRAHSHWEEEWGPGHDAHTREWPTCVGAGRQACRRGRQGPRVAWATEVLVEQGRPYLFSHTWESLTLPHQGVESVKGLV